VDTDTRVCAFYSFRHPLVKVSEKDNNVVLSQEVFAPKGSATTSTIWPIPIRYLTEDGAKVSINYKVDGAYGC